MEGMSLWGCLLGNSSSRISSKLPGNWYFPFRSLPVQARGRCFSEIPRMCTLILSGAFRLGSIWCNFSRDSKRHLSYTRLSPCQISHLCSKAWRRASFLANYLQALITWPKQIILPHLIFWGSQIFLFELSKAKGISCGQTHDMDIFSSNSLSLAKLQTIDSSPGRGSARQAQRQAGLPAPPVACACSLVPISKAPGALTCGVPWSLTVWKLQPYNWGAWQQWAMDLPWLPHQTWRTCPLFPDIWSLL